MKQPDVSVLLVSFNTKRLLSRCLESVRTSSGSLDVEVIIVDNGSVDGSAEYLKAHWPEVKLVETGKNLGFAGANNIGKPLATGRYLVLLNTDAFLLEDALERSVRLMDTHPEVGLAGAKLVGEDGSWQPSARTFPGLWNEFVTLSGLSYRWRNTAPFGSPDLTYRNQDAPMECDWVPGAFSIIRRESLEESGFFDPAFFLYYEEVDLCKRMKQKGWKVMYWPEVRVIHLGGASTENFQEKMVQKNGRQMALWRLQSQYIYYRKHHSFLKVRLSRVMEELLHLYRSPKSEESRVMVQIIRQAWKNTRGGRIVPPVPWGSAQIV